MFCKNCGANLPDSSKFCTSCGAGVSNEKAAPTPPVAAYVPQQPNPMITNFLTVIKNIWAKPVATVGACAKSKTHEWILFAVAGILSYALGTAVVGAEMVSQLLKFLLGTMAGLIDTSGMYPFFGILGIGVLISAVAYSAVSLGLWVLITKIFKKNATFINVLNMVAAASLPLTVINLTNMLIGLIFSPLTVVFFIAAFAMTVVCLYTGTQKFDKLEKSPFYGFNIVLTIVILASCMLGILYFSVIADGISSFAASGISGALGSLLG